MKVQVIGIAGYPDLMCMKNGNVFFIEVKKPGSKPRKLQLTRKRQLNEAGVGCNWFDNADDALAWVRSEYE